MEYLAGCIMYSKIRPYNDSEVSSVLESIEKSFEFSEVFKFIFPKGDITKFVSNIKTMNDFQNEFSRAAVENILEKTCSKFVVKGIENLDSTKSYLFISNHRDIVMDSSLLGYTLDSNGFKVNESAIGQNLLSNNVCGSLAGLMRTFRINRNLPIRELLESSKTVSSYINHVLNDKKRSVWIAQREGRTKDGKDKTQQGLLKMISMNSGEMNLEEYFKTLRIVPMSISYEYDPTDYLKVPELIALDKNLKYEKQEGEDENSIIKGVVGFKGKITLSLSKPLQNEIDNMNDYDNVNSKLEYLCKLIDEKIISNYEFYPNNYIAYDILHSSDEFCDKYTKEQKESFLKDVTAKSEMFKSNETLAKTKLLEGYSNPILCKRNL